MKGLVKQEALANVFRQIRILSGLTQEDMAEILHVDTRQVRRYETVGTDRLNVVNNYAEAFKLDSISILSSALNAY